jgi:hypothetical protein
MLTSVIRLRNILSPSTAAASTTFQLLLPSPSAPPAADVSPADVRVDRFTNYASGFYVRIALFGLSISIAKIVEQLDLSRN